MLKFNHLTKTLFLNCLLASVLVISFQDRLFSQSDGKNQPLPEKGGQAPDFICKDFSGETFTLSQLKNKNVVILWFTNLCFGCQMKIPELEKINGIFKKKGVVIVAVSQLGKDRKTVEDEIRKNKIKFKFLYDPEGKATELFSGKYVPGVCPIKNFYIIQRDGTISYASHYPGIEENEITNELNKIIKGR